MNHVSSLLRSLNRYEWALLAGTAALFLPFQFAAASLALILVFFLVSGRIPAALRAQTGAHWLYAFVILELAVSAFYGNWMGCLNAGGYLLAALYIAVYRQNLTRNLFTIMLELMIAMSWLAAFWGLVEFQTVSARKGYDFFDFVIQNSPRDRINSTFMNANFYATMCVWFILFCVYEYVRHRNVPLRLYYVVTALLNFSMLFLTGCRTALLPFLFIFPLFFGFAGKKKLFAFSVGMEILALILVLSFPEIIPRGSNLSTLFSRIKIWDGAVVLIQMHPLFGMGPVTYGFMYGTMGFHKAPHAHNLLLESLTSYGLVGTTLITGYFVTLIRETMGIMQEHPTTFSLIISFYFTALVLGLLDFTLNFPVTGITFLMVANASCMWKQPVTQPAATAA